MKELKEFDYFKAWLIFFLVATIGAGVDFGIGFGATITYGQTVFVPWPWANYSGG